MNIRRVAILLLLPLTVACISSPVRRQADLGVDVPDAWTATAAQAEPTEEAWWESFDDPRLNELIVQALEYNRDLQAAAARLERAAAEAQIAGADLKPSVEAGLSGARRRQVFIGFPIPEEVPSTTSTSLGLSLSASWEADLWGRVRAGARAALAEFEATGFDYMAARLSIAGQTARAWFAVTEARQQLELARATAESFRASAELVRSRYEAGIRPSLDLRLALTRQAEAEALLELRRVQLDRATRQVEVLVGSYPAGALTAPQDLPDNPPPIATGLPAELISQRPDLMAAERRLAAADARMVQARRSLYPRLSLTAGGGTASNELRDLLDGDFRVWNLVANLTQPLFEGGRLRAGVDRAEAGIEEALALYAAEALRAFAEVESSLSAEEFLAKRQDSLVEAVVQSRAAERLALNRYRSGLEDYITVLESQKAALGAESQLLAVRRARLDNRVDLHLALGGGFQASDELIRLADVEPDGGSEDSSS